MAKLLKNPDNGAPIKDFLFQKKMYELAIGEQKSFDDSVAAKLQETYPWLEEVVLEGKFVCKHGDYSSDYKIAVIKHESTHKEEPQVEEGKEFITPQEIADAERKARLEFDQEGIPVGKGVDKDGVSWYGEGLTTDDEFMGSIGRKPGHF